ncbi:MAG TPA: uracil-DNA glycosylase [Tepidisphaeraceae bacterium]|jgi:hypothetical protein
MTLDRYVRILRDAPPGVFNPWYDFDAESDRSPSAPKWRRENLRAYLAPRIGRARWLLLAEAAGFRGAKFSGITMTCERQLPAMSVPHSRTSRDDLPLSEADRRDGVLEPTATIVRRALEKAGVDPGEVILCNTFAWHPNKPDQPLTNRTPTRAEVAAGRRALAAALELAGAARRIAIGRTAERMLIDTLGLDAPIVRHPANGGARIFTQGLVRLMR